MLEAWLNTCRDAIGRVTARSAVKHGSIAVGLIAALTLLAEWKSNRDLDRYSLEKLAATSASSLKTAPRPPSTPRR